jgi:hypothetical protein
VLLGPENGARNFQPWLIAPNGGAVPAMLAKCILSSNYGNPDDPLQARPMIFAIDSVLLQTVISNLYALVGDHPDVTALHVVLGEKAITRNYIFSNSNCIALPACCCISAPHCFTYSCLCGRSRRRAALESRATLPSVPAHRRCGQRAGNLSDRREDIWPALFPDTHVLFLRLLPLD